MTLNLTRSLTLCLSWLLLSCGCSSPPPSASPTTPTALYPAESTATTWANTFSTIPLPTNAPSIAALHTLDDANRQSAIKTLQNYLRSQTWTLHFTEIVVTDGVEDVATCFFKGDKDGDLVVMLAFHDQDWMVTAYEIPPTAWARAQDETLTQYVNRMMALAREQGVPYQTPLPGDGLYLIER